MNFFLPSKIFFQLMPQSLIKRNQFPFNFFPPVIVLVLYWIPLLTRWWRASKWVVRWCIPLSENNGTSHWWRKWKRYSFSWISLHFSRFPFRFSVFSFLSGRGWGVECKILTMNSLRNSKKKRQFFNLPCPEVAKIKASKLKMPWGANKIRFFFLIL